MVSGFLAACRAEFDNHEPQPEEHMWLVYVDGEWTAYRPSWSRRLNEAIAAGVNPIQVTHAWVDKRGTDRTENYELNWHTMKQTNVASGTSRELMRTVISPVPPELVTTTEEEDGGEDDQNEDAEDENEGGGDGTGATVTNTDTTRNWPRWDQLAAARDAEENQDGQNDQGDENDGDNQGPDAGGGQAVRNSNAKQDTQKRAGDGGKGDGWKNSSGWNNAGENAGDGGQSGWNSSGWNDDTFHREDGNTKAKNQANPTPTRVEPGR